MNLLKFSVANSKLANLVGAIDGYDFKKSEIYSLDLISGWTCPFANDCLSKVIIELGKRKIKDGPKTKFRCFSASQEVVFPDVYNNRKYNFELLKSVGKYEYAALINNSLPGNAKVVRIHVGGDMFNADYLLAWAIVAHQNPHILFYAYTKSLSFWVKHKKFINKVKNLVLTASRGGKQDSLIKKHRLREAIVVNHPSEAKKLGLDIDHDDSHAANPNIRKDNFALLIHGQQPKGSSASKALKVLKQEKVKFSYGNKS